MYMPLMVRLRKVVLFAPCLKKSCLEKSAREEVWPPVPDLVQEKLQALRPFLDATDELHVVSQGDLSASPQPDWGQFLLRGRRCNLAISCLADASLNASLQNFCEQHGILCNAVDKKEYCNTWFMAVAQTASLLLGVSSKGKCPYYTAQLRRELQLLLEQREAEASLLSECRRQLRTHEPSAPSTPTGTVKETLKTLQSGANFGKILQKAEAGGSIAELAAKLLATLPSENSQLLSKKNKQIKE